MSPENNTTVDSVRAIFKSKKQVASNKEVISGKKQDKGGREV
jgi:hypothetical protein